MRPIRLLALAAAVTMSVTAAPGTATANDLTPLVSCPGGFETVTFNPGLTFIPRPNSVHVDGFLAPCVSTSNPEITSATFIVDGAGTGSCLLSDFHTTMVVDWSAGPNSVIRYDVTVNVKPAGQTVFITVGRVHSGQFAGANILRSTVELTADAAKCATQEGVQTAFGPANLTVIPG